MLVLSRKLSESVMVGGSDGGPGVCKVTVLEIRGGRVRLGFDVDSNVPVHRTEIWTKIQAELYAPVLAISADVAAAG
jgi:carbon storage regulator CsrA